MTNPINSTYIVNIIKRLKGDFYLVAGVVLLVFSSSFTYTYSLFCLFYISLACLSLCLFVSLSLCLSVCLFVCLFVCLSVCLFVSLSLCLFVSLSLCLFVCLSVCLFILFVCLSVFCLSSSLSLFPSTNLAEVIDPRVLLAFSPDTK